MQHKFLCPQTRQKSLLQLHNIIYTHPKQTTKDAFILTVMHRFAFAFEPHLLYMIISWFAYLSFRTNRV